jgi:hypothetical protein
MQPKKNTHKKLPIGTNKEITEAQRIGRSRIWPARSPSGSVHRTIKYPKTCPKPWVFIEKYPTHKQAIRNRDKTMVTHQTEYQNPTAAEIRLTEISTTHRNKNKESKKNHFSPNEREISHGRVP